jgi:hypothetical protein
MLFSERRGLKPVKSIIQRDSMDHELRNGLWNVVYVCFLEEKLLTTSITQISGSWGMLRALWSDYFKRPLDAIPFSSRQTFIAIRDYFFSCKWNEVYDFLEFVARAGAHLVSLERFGSLCNSVLEQELSAYRFVGEELVPITAQEEIETIEAALYSPGPFAGVRLHIETALNMLADRESPNYRNSIKESISAVESLAKVVTGKEKATLADALKVIDSKVSLHGALKEALAKLYAYTSDADGIRHAMLEEASLTFNDAKFMLVACSAFINYVIGKCAESGLTFST